MYDYMQFPNHKILSTTLAVGVLLFVLVGNSFAQSQFFPGQTKSLEQAQDKSAESSRVLNTTGTIEAVSSETEILTPEPSTEESNGVILVPGETDPSSSFQETVDAGEALEAENNFYNIPDPEPSRVRFKLPSPRDFFQLFSPIPDPIIEIIDRFNDVLVDPICPAPEISVPNCNLNLVDVSSPTNDYQLIWQCGGSFRPCALIANGETVGHLRGAGVANLNMGSQQTLIYELKGRDGNICGTKIAHSFRINVVPATPNTSLVQSSYRIFSNANSVTPGSALAAENTQATITSTQAFRLRMLIHVAGADLAQTGATLKLQKAEKGADCPSSTWSDVTGGGDIIYNNNATPADGDDIAAISGDPTRGSETVVPQTYQEANNFSNSGSAISAGESGIWDFSLAGNLAFGTPIFCFRAVHSDGSLLDDYEYYPEVFCTGGKGGCF